MTVPQLTVSRFGEARTGKPLLVLVPGLGTSAAALWPETAALLRQDFDLLAVDLPGHGRSPAAAEPFTVGELAEAVDRAVREAAGESGAHFYAGNSLGGAVGLQLAHDKPERLAAVALICSGAALGDPASWRVRGATVQAQGTPVMVDGSARRWFAKDFIAAQPAVASRLLHSLSDTDRFSYAFCCEALAGFDLRGQLHDVRVPVLALYGDEDEVASEEVAALVAGGVKDGSATGLPHVGHQAPAEAPAATAEALREFFGRNGAAR
ncbi:alpha/beta fold hydrolase [Paenarthrobacter sp. DKR-5]|uniref:alpha/beta fold hydrolase n=1 Tax=Paenarthrobacter sp. DKR-5 TaxID=2835535 RepID=UPI001BDD5AE3|nr:alpha/beta fold hydrolase [Paenarthrobacter sp. DKR-5]MBT1001095.1 alpha/beta fold hydrolase [Paenarthrobacter sp. DKR-5]